ncbi:MAG: BolA family protein [Betaproteobacteria bacterium]
MVTPESIQSTIAAGIPCAHIAVDGDGQHFQAVIVSDSFAGLSRIKQHQLVYGVLGDRMREEIHALSLQTFTTDTWRQSGGALG